MNITFDNITASYRKRQILESVSFSVESGSITALIGRNGAGKSTLIRCLTGEKQDYNGRIYLGDHDVRTLSTHERAAKLSCLPQGISRPHVTVRELVSFGRTPYTPFSGRLSAVDREVIDWAISCVGMSTHANDFVDTLSGGERKKAFFSMVLAQNTPVVVLDEPTAHLDAVSRFEFLDLVDRLRRETGKTFLLVMHELPEVLRCADRIIAIHERNVVFNGSPEQCIAKKIPQTVFRIRIRGDSVNGYAALPLK